MEELKLLDDRHIERDCPQKGGHKKNIHHTQVSVCLGEQENYSVNVS
jgi:hypothetical protein